jgi:biopolymer transport protein ExbD
MPDADEQDSLVVAVTASGRVYFGTTLVSPADLAEKVKGSLSGRTGKKLFIKGDSRTPYSGMAKVLDAVRMAGVAAPNLLTAQRDSPEPGKVLPPKGLEVLVGPSLPSASESTTVQVLSAGQQITLSVNNQRISLDALQVTLGQLFRNRSQKTVVLRADERLPYGDVVRVIDTCRAAGAKVFLSTAGR